MTTPTIHATLQDIDSALKILNDLASEYPDERIRLVRSVLRQIRKDMTECQNHQSEKSNSPSPPNQWRITTTQNPSQQTSEYQFWE